MTGTIRSGGFFHVMAWILALMVLAGFALFNLLMPEQASPLRPALIVHALVFFGWYVVLIIQTRLIAQRNYARHKQLGTASIALATALVVMGTIITREAYLRAGWSIAGMSPQSSVMFPFTDILFFSAAYGLAIANRGNAHAHKRLMLAAGLVMLDPALARFFGALALPPPLISAVELALVIAIMVYDRKTLGRIHWATWFGAALLVAVYPAVFIVAQTDAWTGMVTSVWGSPPAI